MIVGDLRGDVQDGREVHGVLKEAVEVLRTTDFSKMVNGTYQIKGQRMFMNIQEYETRSASEVHFEKHAAHIDVQYLISGKEQIGWAGYDGTLMPDEDMLAERDIAFFHNVQSSVSIPMSGGRYVILFPDDLHQPCVNVKPGSPVSVRKAVIKIHTDLLK